MSMMRSLCAHWPEYTMEAAGLGIFMVAACVGTVGLWHEESLLSPYVQGSPWTQRLLMGVAMGLTAIGIIYSPWGKRSGAHINPAVTLTFLRLGKIEPWDAAFYIVAQFVGAVVGVVVTSVVLPDWVSSEAVNYAVTVPGSSGLFLAFIAEVAISFGVMAIVLWVGNSRRFSGYTGIFVGIALVLYITFEAPLSGMSMNPARTVGSAVPAGVYTAVWIYFVAPTFGMLFAAEVFLWFRGLDAIHCAKLNHTFDVRCIFRCGYAKQESN